MMMFPPFASPEHFFSGLSPQNEAAECTWFIMAGDQLLVESESGQLPSKCPVPLLRSLFMGTYRGKSLFAGECESISHRPLAWSWRSLRTLFGGLSEDDFSLAGRAMHLLAWDRSHQFCGCCGQTTFVRDKERCRECRACGHLDFPKLAPAILALVRRGPRILLARGPLFPFYSVLAGFVEPGETLEQCVVREVAEEVGVRVKDVRYFGNQPWPFSQGLMIGFICDWESGEIQRDPSEIEDADWFDREHLPLLPPELSLSRILIEDAVAVL